MDEEQQLRRNRDDKTTKDVCRLANAHFIGRGGDDERPHKDKAYDPQTRQLREVILSRNKDVRCHSWVRSRCVSWLMANPPIDIAASDNDDNGLLPIPPPSPVVPSPSAPARPVPQLPPSPTVSAASSVGSIVKFRWSKHLEARAIAAICADTPGFIAKGLSLSRQQLDAKHMLGVFWMNAADRFNSPAFAPVNEFDHVPELEFIDPTSHHEASITGGELQKKFKYLQSLVTKSVNNYNISGGGTGYGDTSTMSGDINVAGYNWGGDNGMVNVTEESIPLLLARVCTALESFGMKGELGQLRTHAEVYLRGVLERVAPGDDDDEKTVVVGGVGYYSIHYRSV